MTQLSTYLPTTTDFDDLIDRVSAASPGCSGYVSVEPVLGEVGGSFRLFNEFVVDANPSDISALLLLFGEL